MYTCEAVLPAWGSMQPQQTRGRPPDEITAVTALLFPGGPFCLPQLACVYVDGTIIPQRQHSALWGTHY